MRWSSSIVASRRLEGDLNAAAKNGPWVEFVARPRCLRGIDMLTPLGRVTEMGTDWLRSRARSSS
jgi:hypothetical protein